MQLLGLGRLGLRLIMGITRVTIWVIGVLSLLTKPLTLQAGGWEG